MKKPLLCMLGLHRHQTTELDGTPVGPWMTIHKEYLDHCTRCGRTLQFTFYIPRS